MESHPIPAKRPRISVEESAVNQNQQAEMKVSPPKGRWMCNELVHKLCKEIPIVKKSEQILLTAHNIYAYLEPRFSKKLIYRDAIAFLKAKFNAKKKVQIFIDQVTQNNESEPIVVISQQSGEMFELKTNKFRVQIQIYSCFQNGIYINRNDAHFECFECVHLLYFLRLIAPMLQPIQFCLWMTDIPTDGHVRFLDTQSDWIDSIALWNDHLKSEPICGALCKYNKLKIYGTRCPVNVPKLIQWLNSNNNNIGQPKKHIFLWNLFDAPDDGLALLMDELKKEFVRATNKCRFVVRLVLLGQQQLDEFTSCNELTGERLELRRKKIEKGWYMHADERYIYALSRFPNSEMNNIKSDFTELDIRGTQITLK